MTTRVFPSAALLFLLHVAAALTAGELETRTLRSEALGNEVKINVLLPDGYAAEKDRRWPVIYLLHGYGGDYTEWKRVGVVEEAAGLQVIIVMPEGDQSFYVNHHGESKGRWEDYITGEVVKLIDESYRTVRGREGRGISGLSMGGYGAMALGLRHPELFSTVASHSGALGVPGDIRRGEIGERIAKIFGPEGSEARKRYDLKELARGLAKEARPAIYIDCGSSDFLLESNRSLVAELSKLGYAYEYREVPGAHDFAYWKRNVRGSITRQLEAMAKASPSVPAAAAAPAVAARPAGPISGEWSVTATLPDGSEGPSTLHLKQEGEKISGRAEWDGGGAELTRGTFSGGKVVLEVSFERDGEKGTIRVEAKLDGEKLAGKWMLLDGSLQEVLRQDWRAVRVGKPEKAAAPAPAVPPSKAADAAALAGEWELSIELEGNALDYTLRIAEKEGKLTAVLVSPRSGEHAAKSATFKDGALRIAIDREIEGNAVTMVYEGKLEGGKLSGVMTPEGIPDFKASWSAVRKAKAKSEDL